MKTLFKASIAKHTGETQRVHVVKMKNGQCRLTYFKGNVAIHTVHSCKAEELVSRAAKAVGTWTL